MSLTIHYLHEQQLFTTSQERNPSRRSWVSSRRYVVKTCPPRRMTVLHDVLSRRIGQASWQHTSWRTRLEKYIDFQDVYCQDVCFQDVCCQDVLSRRYTSWKYTVRLDNILHRPDNFLCVLKHYSNVLTKLLSVLKIIMRLETL